MKKLNIAFLTTETAPFTNAGGLSVISSFLIKSLIKEGHKVSVFMPFYKCIRKSNSNLKKIEIKYSFENKKSIIYYNQQSEYLDYYFIDDEQYYDREYIYGDENGDYHDNAERFIFFSKAVCEAIVTINHKPDIVHCNEWHCSLVPLLIKLNYFEISNKYNLKTVLTVHNISFQGIFDKTNLAKFPFAFQIYNDNCLKHNKSINFLKAGLLFSDTIIFTGNIFKSQNTHGLEDVVKSCKDNITLIPWAPTVTKSNINSKAICTIKNTAKKNLQAATGLEITSDLPMICFFCDFKYQDGLDITARVIENMITAHQFQFIITFSNMFEQIDDYKKLKTYFPKHILINDDNELKYQQIVDACDIILTTSRHDPSGITIMNALNSGIMPVCRSINNASKYIIDLDEDRSNGNGFIYKTLEPLLIISKLLSAFDIFKDKKQLEAIQIRNSCFKRNWHNVAVEYSKVYTRT